MDSHEFDNVKAEKDIAMRRYHRHRKLKWLLEAFAGFIVLMRSSTWLPIAAGFSRDFFAVFKSHLFVFALFHVIILVVYVSSGRLVSSSKDAGPGPDLYDEFVGNSECSRKILAVSREDSPVPENSSVAEIDVCSENAGSSNPVRNRHIEKPKVSDCTKGEKVLVVKSYQRTQSVRLDRKIIDRTSDQREFRRSCTDIRQRLMTSGEEEQGKQSSSVNQMSNEEFNQTIEAFIAAQKWIQREEYKEERKTERYLALTVCR